MSNIKQVLVIRKDLNMRKGKICAQCAHASMKVFFDRMDYQNITGTSIDFTSPTQNYELRVTKEMKEWIEGDFKKICVGVNSEQELIDIYNKAKFADLPCAIIEDNGLTEFNGIKTKTAIAIGLDESEKIDKITGGLKLL